jgi:hypothetical protein
MGLAFDLDALDLPGLDWEAIFTLASTGVRAPSYGGFQERWQDIAIDPDNFDVTIRDVKQINGMLALCGTYRARSLTDPWNGPGGTMQNALFYDGFIALQRAFTWTFALGSNASSFNFKPFKAAVVSDPISWLVVPMRMPFEVNPGTALNDPSVGLYSLEALKSIDPFSGTTGPIASIGEPVVQIATCGFSSTNDPGSQGLPIGQDYVPNLYILPVIVGRIPVDSGYWIAISPAKEYSAQMSWRCNGLYPTDDNGGVYNTAAEGRFGVESVEVGADADPINRLDLDKLASDSTYNVFNIQYGFDYPDNKLSDRKRFPRRFLSLATTSVVLPGGEPFDLDAFGPLIIGGDCTYAPGGTVTGTFPLVSYNYWPNNTDRNITEFMPLLTCFTDENIQIEGGVGGPSAYTLDGAYFRYVIPSNDFLAGAPEPDTPFEPTLLLAENVTHGASTSAEIYIISGNAKASAMTIADGQLPGIGPDPLYPGTPVQGATCITPYAVSGGAWETATGLTLPQRWTGYALQMRTFTRDEEFASRNDDNAGPQQFETVQDENGTLVGLIDNYPRYGFRSGQDEYIAPGNASNQVVLLMGVTISGGNYTPHLLAFDNGTISAKPTAGAGGPVTTAPPYQIENTGYVKDYGTIVQSQIITSSKNSYPVSASWDNDRDQWLIIYNRDFPSSYALISARSDFTQFIDQSPNVKIFTGLMGNEQNGGAFYEIPPSSNYRLMPAGIYTARLMTNELDGIVIGGEFADLSDPLNMSSIKPIKTNPLEYPIYSNFTTVRGTTGRTARVWVDYVLYDGVDALVATKLSELGLRVTPENVEWFKSRILRSAGVDELDVKTEEIEQWMEAQRKEYTDMLRTKERAGRLRKRKRQVSAYREGAEGALAEANKSSVDTRALDPEEMDDLLKDIGMPDDGYSSDRKRS